jgi:putative ABC transport system ATP-binding protein
MAAHAEADVLRLQSVCKVYGTGDATVNALKDVDLHVERGDFVAVIGPSGSGKSTLMNILGCLDTPTTGEYWFSGDGVKGMTEHELARIRNLRIGFVFQQFQLLSKMSALQNVELPLRYRVSHDRRGQALRALDQVGLGHRVTHRPTELSGGQQQRVAIARALVTNPDLVLADEPTGNLDSASTKEVLQILRDLNEGGRTVILITHDAEVAAVAKRVMVMSDGVLTEKVAA